MSKKTGTIYHKMMTAALSLVLVAGLVLPLETDPSHAASYGPNFSNKPVIKAKLTTLKKNGRQLNLRLEANQSITGFDTLQGSCYGGGYIYYLLWHHVKDQCKVVKMRRSDLTVVKVSPALRLNHGNDMTYNTHTGRLIVSNARPARKYITVINSGTLRIEKRIKVELPKDLPGIDWDRINSLSKNGYNGFNNIAYNSKYNQYVVQLYTVRDLVFLDSNFRPVRYERLYKRDSQVYQGIESFGDRIVVCNSYSSGKPDNVLSVYDWNGNYLSKVVLGRGQELESIYHVGNQLYAGFYKAYTARYKWINKTKKVKKKVKVRVKVKVKVNGKKKYKYVTKTKKKKVTVRYYAKQTRLGKRFLNRDSYIYRVTNL